MLRLIFVGGVLAYRALFNWTTPAMFISTLFGAPLGQLFFYTFVGRQLGVADTQFYLAGNTVMAASTACLYGGAMAVANERRYGTLGSVILSSRSRAGIFLGRVLPYAANGVLVSMVTLAVGSLFLRVRLPATALPELVAVAVIASTSCAFFGLMLGAVGLLVRDLWLITNLMASLLLLFTGVNVPPDRLPAWVRDVGGMLPITHAAEAARRLTAGVPLRGVSWQIVMEAALGAGYAVLAAALLRWFERRSRVRAAVDVL
jgi:ABC-2 type transport system permease protein